MATGPSQSPQVRTGCYRQAQEEEKAMSSGIGETNHPEEWKALQAAAQAYGAAVYGPEYICHEFVLIGFMVSMAGDTEFSEYVIGTSSAALHVNEGLVHRGLQMLVDPPDDEDD